MELETAARRFLLGVPDVNGYVARKVFKHNLLMSPEGTGGCAIVVRRTTGWASPDTVQTAEFPRLVVECWADPDRDPDGSKAVDNAEDKALALFRVVDKALHGLRDVWWGAGGTDPGRRIVSCVRSEEPAILSGADASPDNRRSLFGEMAMVPAMYDIETVG